MRPYVILLLIVLALILSIRAYYTHRIPIISFILIAIILTPLVITEGLWIKTERTLSAAVREITHRDDVSIHCQRATEAFFFAGAELGHVMFDEAGRPSKDAFITMETCQRVRAWMNSDKNNPTREEMIAVHVVTHEAMHLAGQTSEAIAECDAMQSDTEFAEILGANHEQARELAEQYYQMVFPEMSDPYRSVTCQENGALDKTPNDDQWP